MQLNEVEVIEKNIQEAQEIVDKGNALERLYANKDFRTVIMKGYMEQEAVRLVHAKGNVALQSAESQASIIKQIDAISSLSAYFRKVNHEAEQARKAIEADEATREELLQEDIA